MTPQERAEAPDWLNIPGKRPVAMYAGANGLPAHIYPNCPHLQRKVARDGCYKVYRLSGSGGDPVGISTLLRCTWCRNHWLTAQVEGRPI